MTSLYLYLEILHHVRQILLRLTRRDQMNGLYQRATALGIVPADIEAIACTAHEAVKAWARTQGDFSHDAWGMTSLAHKNRMREGVLARLERPEETAEENHERWTDYMVADGWQWGPERDEDKQIHPALVEWENLPVTYRARNEIFTAVVKALDPRQYSD